MVFRLSQMLEKYALKYMCIHPSSAVVTLSVKIVLKVGKRSNPTLPVQSVVQISL